MHTVMLLSSSPDEAQMYSEYLQRHGFETIAVDNTADALARAASVEVIVTGIQVPGPFDGLDLVRRLRANRATGTKKVILLTACAFETDRQRAQAAGCDRFLVKPCLPDTLLNELRQLAPAS